MSQLDDYIKKLMSDDRALQGFLANPIKAAEDENGLTKAQRSVLRRVVANLSNNATNGYSIVRHLDSYRRSIRMLQNVLHMERGASPALYGSELAEGAATSSYQLACYLYYPTDPGDTWPTPNPQAYANYLFFTGTTTNSNLTVDEAMQVLTLGYGPASGTCLLDLATVVTGVHGVPVVTAFNIPHGYLDAGLYTAVPGVPGQSNKPFWFYSFNGTARPGAPYYGGEYFSYGSSQTGLDQVFPLRPSGYTNYLYWQIIAPEPSYGFQSCVPTTAEKAF